MILAGPNGQLELAIRGYEFPHIKNDWWDSNWLTIRIRARDSRGESWERTGPFLTTFEIEELATWFLAVVAEAPMINRETLRESSRQHAPGFPNLRLFDSIDFMEPNLRFALVERSRDLAGVRVYFELEARPPSAPDQGAGMEDLWIDLNVSASDLKAAALTLRSELRAFPIRAAQDSKQPRDGSK